MSAFGGHQPFDNMSQETVDRKIQQIYLAAVNGCPMDLPREILEWPSLLKDAEVPGTDDSSPSP